MDLLRSLFLPWVKLYLISWNQTNHVHKLKFEWITYLSQNYLLKRRLKWIDSTDVSWLESKQTSRPANKVNYIIIWIIVNLCLKLWVNILVIVGNFSNQPSILTPTGPLYFNCWFFHEVWDQIKYWAKRNNSTSSNKKLR